MKTVSGVRAAPHLSGERIDLDWQNPPASDFSGAYEIGLVRRERTFPLSPNDGDLIYQGPVIAAYSDMGLQPLTAYYYTVFTIDGSGFYADAQSRAATLASQNYNLTGHLYSLLPAVHQRDDMPLRPAELAELDPAIVTALKALPPAVRGRGPLWRFFHAAAAPLDLMRSFAEALPQLHNIDLTRPDYLPLLAQWLGWNLDRTLAVFMQRNEIKFAPHRYRTVGTLPNLAAIVNRYTGWHAQIAEFVQHLVRSNHPAQLNIFAIEPENSTWRGTDDAAPVLGFGAANNTATGSGTTPATLTGTTSEPFALRPGMVFAVTADARLPVAVRFREGDFDDITAATAEEVATVFERTLSQVTVTTFGGVIELSSHTVGPDSALRVEQYAASRVTLEGAPGGRLSAFQDSTARVRLFYQTADPLAEATLHEAAEVMSGQAFTAIAPRQPEGRVFYKTLRAGIWGESIPLTAVGAASEADPAAVELPDGRVWVAWIEAPHTPDARIRFKVGEVATPTPAHLQGQRSQPFVIKPGTHLFIRGNWREPEGITLTGADFGNPQQATLTEVINALNARLTRVTASAGPGSTLVLETLGSGGGEHVEIDLRQSSAARALGFDTGNAAADGSWGDEIVWDEAQDVTAAPVGYVTDLHALVDSAGLVWLFWAEHTGRRWQIAGAQWDSSTDTWSASAVIADADGHHREPCAVLDSTDNIWLFWAHRAHTAVGWRLARRVFDATTSTWGAAQPLITPAPGPSISEREPGVIRLLGGDLRVFFASDREGGFDVWSVTVTPATDTVSPPEPVTSGAYTDRMPAPVLLPGDQLWLLYRSDRSLSLSRAAEHSFPVFDNRVTSPPHDSGNNGQSAGLPVSLPVSDTGSVRRYAGSLSAPPRDAARVALHRRWDDLLGYTTQNPRGTDLLHDYDLYTRGTLGLYLSRIIPDSPISQQKVERLRTVLREFLPINVRVVVILAPRIDVEFVYPPGADIEESYFDNYPFVDYYTGLDDSTAAALPDWVLLLSNDPEGLSGDPADPETLRRRTYSPWLD